MTTLFFVIHPCVLYANVAFSILVPSIKKRYSGFLKKIPIFKKICFRVKVLKTSEISSDSHIKIFQSLNQRFTLKISVAIF